VLPDKSGVPFPGRIHSGGGAGLDARWIGWKTFVMMNILSIRLLAVLLSLGGAISWVVAAPGVPPPGRSDFITRLWLMEDGLPHNNVEAVTQTPDGYLWAGTSAGLARFDGVRFVVFDVNNTPALGHSYIRALCLRQDGSLWIGTAAGKLSRMIGGKFTALDPGRPENLGNILCLFEDRDGVMWVGTEAGLLRYDNAQWTRFTTEQGLLHNSVRAVCEFEGRLAVATDLGVNLWQDGRFIELNPPGAGPAFYARALWSDRAGNLWLGFRYGLGLLNADRDFTLFTRKDGLPDENETVLFEDRRANLWIGSMGGLARRRDGKFYVAQQADGSAYGRVRCLFEDREGSLWVGTRDGLSQLRPRRFQTYTTGNGLAHNNVMSVLEDRHGTIWCTMWGGGLASLQGDVIRNYTKEDPAPNALNSDNLLSVFEDRNGDILVGQDYEGGVFALRDGRFTLPYPAHANLLDQATRIIFRDRADQLWFGLNSGLVLWDTQEKFLAGAVVRDIVEDPAGTLWVASSRGIWKRGRGQFEQITTTDSNWRNRPSCLWWDVGGDLWWGTDGAGLRRRRADGAIREYTTRRGLFSDQVGEVLRDDFGWLWFGSTRGIFRVRADDFDELDAGRLATLRCIPYGREDGLVTVQCNDFAKPAAWKSRDGRLWFATIKGLAVINPQAERNLNPNPPPVLIEEIVANKRTLVPPATGNLATVLRIPPGRGDVEIHYTGLSLQVPERVRFRYRLSDQDSEWIEAGNRRSVYYSSLPPGKYRFEVTACNSDGVWSETGAAVAFVLRPYFWQTWWFAGLVLVTLFGVVGGTSRFVTRRRMQRKLARLEQQNAIERERARIARDMHDELGAKLTRISFQGAMAQRRIANPAEAGGHISIMSQTARELVTSLDQIVWAVDPENDSLENLANYICRHASEFVADSPMRCEFVIPAALPPCRLSTEVRHNLFLAVKEALNNAVKHSGGTLLTLTIAVRQGEIEIQVADDGRGLPVAAAPVDEKLHRVGRGLGNMRERLHSIRGQFILTSAPGQGTKIRFIVSHPDAVPVLSSNHPTRSS
jgi:ligand-binding sensor domain-containing protein/signal transduction histidine kinase